LKVLIIPEDQELDRYIAQPVVEALFDDLGRTARIAVISEPRLRGASQALDREMIARIIEENPMEDLFLLVVDRDCDREGNVAKAHARQAEHADKLIACLAVHEIEVWMLALHKESLSLSMADVRAHCDPKEEWAEPFLARSGSDGPGRGRKHAMQAIKGKWRSLRDTCTELRELQETVRLWIDARGRKAGTGR
jgi:hypothetical protein